MRWTGGVIKYLCSLLKQKSVSILKEALWTISNIIAGSTELVTTACKHNS